MHATLGNSANLRLNGVANAGNMLFKRQSAILYHRTFQNICLTRELLSATKNSSKISGVMGRAGPRYGFTSFHNLTAQRKLVWNGISSATCKRFHGVHSSTSVGQCRSRTPGGSDQLDKLLASLNGSTRDGVHDMNSLIQNVFPFEMDQFQKDALSALAAGQSVVLSAPTGAGKTVVGEIAIYIALCRGNRIFYTTPLKALSNQKYFDFKKLFGDDRVGLVTGDQTINREADILVMTTEVYRNMLYSDSAEDQHRPPATENLFAVVFDEFHYLNDRDRGTVWEESVINSPPHVLLVALSATMSNANDVREWFAAAQGSTALVQSDIRPVPLSFFYFDREGITPLFENAQDKTSHKKNGDRGFKRRSRTTSKKRKDNDVKLHPKLLRKIREGRSEKEANGRKGRLSQEEEADSKEQMIIKYKEISRRRDRNRKKFMELPSFPYVVRGLRRRDMLPCIVFIFSRAGCDRAAMAASSEQDSLVSVEEKREIKARLDAFIEKRPGMVQKERLNLALQGIASHHAGLLPLWKLCVEEMFQDGLIKVVFATETLAAGINMPARTTVISSLSKRTGDTSFNSLTTSEVLQMSGRAGRRGMDTKGYAVILKSKNEGPMEAFRTLTAPVDALESKFSPSYGMVLNLLSARPIAAARKLVDRSFGNFLRRKERESEQFRRGGDGSADADLLTVERERSALESVLQNANDLVASCDDKLLRSYSKSLERVKAERRALTYLLLQGEAMNAELVEETLTFAPAGTRLLLRERKTLQSAGQGRRQVRREYSSAIAAAASGDAGRELESFYLEPRDPELELLEDDDNERMQEIEAVLLDMYAENTGVLPGFVAVDADGHLRLFNHTAVSQLLYDSDPIDVEACAPGWREATLLPLQEWESLGGEQRRSPSPESLKIVVDQIQIWRQIRSKGASDSNSATSREIHSYEDTHGPEIGAQHKRLEHAKQLMRNHELHGMESTPRLLAAKRAIPTIEAILGGRYDPLSNKKRQGKGGTYKRYMRRGAKAQDGTGKIAVRNDSWDEFMSLVSVLQHYGFLDENHNLTSLGALGAKMRSENELWSSLVILDPNLENVSPVSLGAILGSTLMEMARSDAYVAQEVSEEVKQTVSQIASERVRLFAIQNENSVAVPVSLDAELMGLVELWASGVSWVELLSATSLQEGDVCRILRRVLDMLRQIQHLPVVGSGLKRNAKRAIALLDRFPVTDDVTYTISENERIEDNDGE